MAHKGLVTLTQLAGSAVRVSFSNVGAVKDTDVFAYSINARMVAYRDINAGTGQGSVLDAPRWPPRLEANGSFSLAGQLGPKSAPSWEAQGLESLVIKQAPTPFTNVSGFDVVAQDRAGVVRVLASGVGLASVDGLTLFTPKPPAVASPLPAPAPPVRELSPAVTSPALATALVQAVPAPVGPAQKAVTPVAVRAGGLGVVAIGFALWALLSGGKKR